MKDNVTITGAVHQDRIHDSATKHVTGRADYTDDIARRVQRLFDGVRPGMPIWRFNALWYEDPSLYQPRAESEPRPLTEAGKTPYLRSERQVLWRLPDSEAVLFTIHTFVLARNDVPGAAEQA